MVSFAQLSGKLDKQESNLPNQDDLRKEVERLRYEVELAGRGIVINEDDVDMDVQMPP